MRVILAVLLASAGVAEARSHSLSSMVVTPDENVAFAIESDGISAIELTTGKVKWRSKLGVRPVGRVGDALVVIDPKSAVVVLDAKTGKAHETCPSLNTSLALRDHHSANASSRWWAVSESSVIKVHWRNSSQNSWNSGMRPTQEQENELRRSARSTSGTIVYDVAKCTFKALTDPAPEMVLDRVVATTPNATAVKIVNDDTGGLRAQRTLAGKTLPDIDLARSGRITWRFSLTDQHVLVANWDRAGHVTVFDLETGRQVGTAWIPLPGRYVVVGTSIVYDSGVVDLATGKLVWSRAIAEPIVEKRPQYKAPSKPK